MKKKNKNKKVRKWVSEREMKERGDWNNETMNEETGKWMNK